MFELKMETDNAAFFGSDGVGCKVIKAIEVARILRTVVRYLCEDKTEGKLTDLNGNTVGDWKLS